MRRTKPSLESKKCIFPNFSLEEIEDGEREPADEEDRDHADQQPAGPEIVSTALSVATNTTSSSSVCPPE